MPEKRLRSDEDFPADERRCLELLEKWEEALRELRDFVGPASVIAQDEADPQSKAWAEEARTRLETLKHKLHAEAERLAFREQCRELNDAESRYYSREIQHVSANLTIGAKSTSGEEWRQQLGAALAALSEPVFQLRTKRDGAAKE